MLAFNPAAMILEGTWQKWLNRLYNLRRDRRGAYERPHKPTLLLAILELLDRHALKSNEIALNPALIHTFNRYFNIVRNHNDRPSIENPFYFLSGDGFWHLLTPSGKADLYQVGSASRAPSVRALRQVCGSFDKELWALMQDPQRRQLLREAIISRYFPDKRDRILTLSEQAAPVPGLERPLEKGFPPGRGAAFRQTVLEVYDYRCAACGIRVKLDNSIFLVEAAHIIPFHISLNDRPDNGLALCPNHHWAMDRHLIAPCPDPKHRAGVWRVGRCLDSRIEGQNELIALAHQPVIPPAEEKFYPAPDCLLWRSQHFDAEQSSLP